MRHGLGPGEKQEVVSKTRTEWHGAGEGAPHFLGSQND
jgi:hypothetical protein